MAANPNGYVHVTDKDEATARIAKCISELHETVILTREIIYQSRDYLHQADRLLADRCLIRGTNGE